MASSTSTQYAWLKKFASENILLIVWNLILLCGGSILLIFHVELLYLPEFSLGDLAGLMASVTFIGIFFVFFFAFVCFIPGLTLRWIYNDWPLIPYQGYFSSPSKKIVLIILPMLLWGTYLFIPDNIRNNWPIITSAPAFFAAIAISSLLLSLILANFSFISLKNFWKYNPLWRDFLGLFLWTFLIFFPIQISFILANSGELKRETYFALVSISFLIILNGIVFITPKGKLKYLLAAGALIIAVFLPLMAGQSLFFPKTLMHILSLGNKNATTVTLSGKNCFALERFGVTCSDHIAKDGALELDNVNILSRIGNSVLIELLVKESDSLTAKNLTENVSANLLHLQSKKRSTYCSKNENIENSCSGCDSLLLERAQNLNESNKKDIEIYKRNLICVRLTIPKNEILNTTFSSKRRYLGFSSFNIPVNNSNN